MRTKLLNSMKTLLVAAGLLTGTTSAWAATTWDFTDTSIWGSATSKANNSLYKGGDSEVYYTAAGDIADASTSNVSFLFSSETPRFNYGGVAGFQFGANGSTSANRIKVNVPIGATATITVQRASGSRPIAVHDGTSVIKTLTSATSYAYTNTSEVSAATLYIYASSNGALQQQSIASISIAETFTITTHYYYNDGENNTSIADDNVTAVESGSSYTLPYEETIQSGDYTYTYSSGAQTIASVSASAEYSIFYTRSERQKYSVSVTAKYGENTVTIAESAEYSEGEVVKYYAPAYYLDGTTLYAFPEDDGDDNNSDGITWGGSYTVTAAKDIVLNYEAQDGEFVAYVEGEALSGATAQQDHYKDLMSNGTGGVISSESPAKVATLPAGIYQLTIRSIGRSSDNNNARTCSVIVGDETTSWTQNTSGSINTLNITLTESTEVKAFGGYKTSSSNAWNLDFIYIQKISDITFALADGDAQHVTFHNAGSGSANDDNWKMNVFDGVSKVSEVRADWWDNVAAGNGNFTNSYLWSADGGITNAGAVNWDTFKSDSQDADCDLTISYSEGTVYIIGTMTKGTDVYYVNYSKSGFTGTAGIYLYGKNATLTDITTEDAEVTTAWVGPSYLITTPALGTNGYATFASSYPLDLTTANLPEGLTAYKATVSGTTVTFTPLNQTVPANTGVLLEGNNGATYNIPVVNSGSAVEDNEFLVNTAGTIFDAEDVDADSYYFGLIKNTLTFGVFDPTTVAVPANKAYLKVEKSSIDDLGSRSLTVVFGDDASGISQIENGRLKMEDVVFSLSGQRVSQPAKGLYIVNGKKIIIK